MLALAVVIVFAIAGADPVLKLFTWLTNLGALGVLLLMAATSFAVVGYFRAQPGGRAEHLVGRRIAPALAGVLLLVILVLGVAELQRADHQRHRRADRHDDDHAAGDPVRRRRSLGLLVGAWLKAQQAGRLRGDRRGRLMARAPGRIDVASVADRVYAALREQILAGDLEPESRLHQEGISAELGVSRTPVREAIARLAAEGLVELLPNRGARVAAIGSTTWRRRTSRGSAFEPLAARLAALRAATLRRAAQGDALAGPKAAYAASARSTSRSLSASGNPFLVDFANAVWAGRIGLHVYARQMTPRAVRARTRASTRRSSTRSRPATATPPSASPASTSARARRAAGRVDAEGHALSDARHA